LTERVTASLSQTPLKNNTYPIAASVGYLDGLMEKTKTHTHPILLKEEHLIFSILTEMLNNENMTEKTKHKIKLYLDY